jgi:excisionase family DNA binding protein
VLVLKTAGAQMTMQEAADFLGVSRPFLIKEMEEGRLRFRKVGTHRRLDRSEVVAYRELCRKRHERAMDKLVKQAQELDMGY